MEEKKANELHHLKAIEIDERAVEISKADECTRRALNTAIKDYNQALVRSSTHNIVKFLGQRKGSPTTAEPCSRT